MTAKEYANYYSSKWDILADQTKRFIKEWLEYENYAEDNGEIEDIDVVDVQNYKGYGYDLGEARDNGAVVLIAITTTEGYSEILAYADGRISMGFGLDVYSNEPNEDQLRETLGLK